MAGFETYLAAHQPPFDGLPFLILPVKEFILVKACPPAWRVFDLYVIRDQQVVFYVGKSESAFYRLWQHILDGYKGRSTIGRFILVNWRLSMDFMIELLDSRSTAFAGLNNDLAAIERDLIGRYAPCFNVVSNPTPTALPQPYLPTTAPIQNARRVSKMAREAGYVHKADKRKGWLADCSSEDREAG